jgi:hypothetical protein
MYLFTICYNYKILTIKSKHFFVKNNLLIYAMNQMIVYKNELSLKES